MSEDKESNLVYAPKSKMDKDTITIYGAGKFKDEKLVLDKVRASFLFIELSEFLKLNK